MSIHLVTVASQVTIKPSAKLVLLGLCESAKDNNERRTYPGVEALMMWANVSRARTFELISDLSELRLVEQTRRGQKYQRAEFVVFPEGCCELHGPFSGSSRADAEQGVDSPTGRTLKSAQGPLLVAQGPLQTLSGSGGPDPFRTSTSVTTSMSSSSSLRSLDGGDCEHDSDPTLCAICRRARRTA